MNLSPHFKQIVHQTNRNQSIRKLTESLTTGTMFSLHFHIVKLSSFVSHLLKHNHLHTRTHTRAHKHTLPNGLLKSSIQVFKWIATLGGNFSSRRQEVHSLITITTADDLNMRCFLKWALAGGGGPTDRKWGQIDWETDGREADTVKPMRLWRKEKRWGLKIKMRQRERADSLK